MNDKVNVEVIVPEINQSYNILLPINKRMATIASLLNQAINELSNGSLPILPRFYLYNCETMQRYEDNILLYNTDIRNSTRLLLFSHKIV